MRPGEPPALCSGPYAFREAGKEIGFKPRGQEATHAVVLDDCVFQDNELCCDGLFLWKDVRGRRKIAVLVELKGASDIPHAFSQLAHVERNRPEYQQLLTALNHEAGGQAQEKLVIVTNGQLKKTDQEKLELDHGIRVVIVQHRAPTQPVPDLREHLF